MAASEDSSYAAIQRYVERTGLAQVIFSLMQQILEKPLLPLNPFALFDGPLRGHAEHMDIWALRTATSEALLQSNTIEQHPEDAAIAVTRGGPVPVWGLPALVAACDLGSIAKFKALAAEFALPDVEPLRQTPAELAVSVGGAALAPDTHGGLTDVIFRLDVFISSELDDALPAFTAVVLADVQRWTTQPAHMLVDLTTGGPDGGTWSWLQLRAYKGLIEIAIAAAARACFPVSARVLMQVQPGLQVLPTIVYSLHCQQTGATQPFPESAIYQGVFFNELDARRCFRLRGASAEDPQRVFATETLDRAIAADRCLGWSHFAHQMYLFFVLSSTVPTACRELTVLLADGIARISAALEAGLLLRTIAGGLMTTPAPLPRAARTLASRLVGLLTDLTGLFDEERVACRAVLQYSASACQRLESPSEVYSALSLVTSVLALVGSSRLEDRIAWLPAISHGLKYRMAAQAPAPAAPQAARRVERTRSKTKAPKKDEPPPEEASGPESVYVDVAVAMQRSAVPAAIRREAILTQYCTDTRLDAVAHETLFDLLSGASLPPNPYRPLVTAFRHAGRRLTLCTQPSSRLLETLTSGPTAPVKLSASSVLCTIPDSQLFGLRSALVAIDPARLRVVVGQVSVLRCQTLPYRRGYRSAVHFALSGDCCQVGTFLPTVSEIDLVEFCTVAGSSRDEAQLLFCQGVSEHLTDLVEHSQERNYIMLGVRAGGTHLTPAEFGNAASLRAALQAALQNRDLIQIELALFIERRYVLVKKSMLLRVVTDAGPVALGPAALSSLLFECVFIARDGTSEVLADMPVPETAAQLAEKQIVDAAAAGSLYQAYRLLLHRARVQSVFTLLPSLWRMTHSPAQQCVLLNSINRVIRILLKAILDGTLTLERVNPIWLTQMFLDFESQTLALLRAESVFVSSTIVTSVTTALLAVWLPGRKGIHVRKETIALLEFVSNMLTGLLVMIAEDVHRICPDVAATLASLVASRAPSRR
eukprot:m.121648 g.121648  ORF g.121648 m.121648 type:complete len:992 (+) comp14583_c0_seq2:126-3101(+)